MKHFIMFVVILTVLFAVNLTAQEITSSGVAKFQFDPEKGEFTLNGIKGKITPATIVRIGEGPVILNALGEIISMNGEKVSFVTKITNDGHEATVLLLVKVAEGPIPPITHQANFFGDTMHWLDTRPAHFWVIVGMVAALAVTWTYVDSHDYGPQPAF